MQVALKRSEGCLQHHLHQCPYYLQKEVHHRAQTRREGRGQEAGHHHKHLFDSPATDRGAVIIGRLPDMQTGFTVILC